MTSSSVVLAKHKAITLLVADSYCKEHSILRSDHPFLPIETAAVHLDEEAALKHRQDEAHLEILANFIQECQSSSEPLFKATETLDILGHSLPVMHPLALATYIQNIRYSLPKLWKTSWLDP
jgi:hypothetical protein